MGFHRPFSSGDGGGGGGGGDGGGINFGNGLISETTTPRYLDPGYNPGLAPVSPTAWTVLAAGNLQSFYVNHTDPAATGGDIVYTVWVNGVSTPITVTVAADATGGSDLSNTAAVVAGDLVTVEVAKPVALAAAPTRITCSMKVG